MAFLLTLHLCPISTSITNDLNLCAHSGSPSVNAGSAGPTIAIDLSSSPAAAPPSVLPAAAPPVVPAKRKLPASATHPMQTCAKSGIFKPKTYAVALMAPPPDLTHIEPTSV